MVMVWTPLMLVRSHSNGGALDSAESACGATEIWTLVRLQSSRASTRTVKSCLTVAPAAGSRMVSPGALSSCMQPNADGFGPPGQAPSVPFIMPYEFCVARSQRSPSVTRSWFTNPSQSLQMVGYMRSLLLLVCSSPMRCAPSCAMMIAVCLASLPPRNVYATPPCRSLHRNGDTPATLSSTPHQSPPPEETTSV